MSRVVECPLCHRDRGEGSFGPLYGAPVCRRCRHAFASYRQLAFLIDWFIWHIVCVAFGAAGAAALVVNQADDAAIDAFLLGWAYVAGPLLFFCKDGYAGYSPGKALCGVRVVDETSGRPIGFRESLKRNLVLWIPLLPLVIAFLLAPGRRAGDRWAGTKVIWRRHAEHPVFTGRDTCRSCHYDLTGNASGVCPECGTGVRRVIFAPPTVGGVSPDVSSIPSSPCPS